MDEQFEIEVFRPGTFTPMSGAALTFSAEDLAAVAAAYDPAGAPAPAVVGHPTTDAPAFGWASGFRYDGERGKLIATVGDLQPAFAEAVRAKRYRKVSMSFHKPDAPANPKPGSWYPKHIGFLGAAAPAVPGLAPVAFSGKPDEAVVIEFGEPGFRDTASMFRRMRDWMIESVGLEKADEILPAYEIEWLSRRADDPAPGFTAPNPAPELAPLSTPPTDAAFAARETAITERERKLAERERKLAEREALARHADHEAFCEGLVKAGRMLPVSKAENVALLDALAAMETPIEVSFSDASGQAKKDTPLEMTKRNLQAAPVQVDFSMLPRDTPAGGSASFAAPDGREVDTASLDLHARAEAFQAKNPGTDWLAAVRAVR